MPARVQAVIRLRSKAIEDHFTSINATIRWVERARAEAEPLHLDALQDFAARAYRRPLSQSEKADLVGYYRSVRKQGLDHEEAMRDSIVSVLMSPDFCYRIDLIGDDKAKVCRDKHPVLVATDLQVGRRCPTTRSPAG